MNTTNLNVEIIKQRDLELLIKSYFNRFRHSSVKKIEWQEDNGKISPKIFFKQRK